MDPEVKSETSEERATSELSETTDKTVQEALTCILQHLSRRDHSPLELEQKLSARFSVVVLQQALALARDRQYLRSEQSLGQDLIEQHLRKLKSHAYIEAQLHQRGLPVPAFAPDAELAIAEQLLEKKFGPLQNLQYDLKSKACRYLQSRGFADRTIRMVLNVSDESIAY